MRDQLVGAPKEAYRHNLHRIAYNTRYLLVPWVNVPHLASHLLGQMARRLSEDWQALYGHPIDLLESFVDTERFEGCLLPGRQLDLCRPLRGPGHQIQKRRNPGLDQRTLGLSLASGLPPAAAPGSHEG